MTIRADLLARFGNDLARLVPAGTRIGVAVSGGPDSLALLLLAAEARPGAVEAATVDHRLRPESIHEAALVANICGSLRIPHVTLPVTVEPGASLQARSREARYSALATWAKSQGIAAVLTGHHADDQAETLLMRLARGAGLAGLAGVRGSRPLAAGVQLARPLLGWRKSELEEIVRSADLTPVEDPSNSDPRHDRTTVRNFLAQEGWLQPERLAASAAHLADAEEALAFAAGLLFEERRQRIDDSIRLDAEGLPRELARRLLLLAFSELGASPPRGPDMDRALKTLLGGGTCTLGGIKLEGGSSWRLSPAPLRR